MNRRTTLLAAVIAGAPLIAGCWESSTEVTVAEPGQYKGVKDPLLAQQAASREDQLKKRFQLVQLDR